MKESIFDFHQHVVIQHNFLQGNKNFDQMLKDTFQIDLMEIYKFYYLYMKIYFQHLLWFRNYTLIDN